MQLTLRVKMTTAQVVETSVTVNNNSPIQGYVHPNDQTRPTFEMTPGFKPLAVLIDILNTRDTQARPRDNSSFPSRNVSQGLFQHNGLN